ncbi:leucyl aminopeptidase family protein [Candidatus Saccharibacteria bacterium]|nr:leucyl aminopeptidase family protein [Candidatus Saccharibacteria bacterium]
MSQVINDTNSKALQVHFLAEQAVKNHANKALFRQLKFAGQYKQAALVLEQNSLFIGLSFKPVAKNADPFCKVQWYEVGAKIANTLEGTKIKTIELTKPAGSFGAEDLQRLALGIMQAGWHYDKYLDNKKAKTKHYTIYLDSFMQKLAKDSLIKEIEALDDAMRLTRTIVNEPPEDLNPHTVAKLVEAEFKPFKNVIVKILGEQQLESLGMQGVMFVGRASRYQPRLVHVTLKPSGKVKNRICLIGKGITYDSGGLDIKTDQHMKTMKMDMAGGATMFGVAKALAQLGLKNTELHWLSAFAENMIGPDSYKADDVITTYSGQTVEVYNTDAEGRLTLADVLSYATTFKPDYIVDAATLTGAAIGAVSERFTALMGNDAKLIDSLLDTFRAEGEYTLYTPMPESLREEVAGDISDLINTSKLDRMAGHITAGLFLSHFVNQNNFRNPDIRLGKPQDYPWVHLDIAGSAFNNSKNGLETNGATGQSVRSLAAWVQQIDQD